MPYRKLFTCNGRKVSKSIESVHLCGGVIIKLSKVFSCINGSYFLLSLLHLRSIVSLFSYFKLTGTKQTEKINYKSSSYPNITRIVQQGWILELFICNIDVSYLFLLILTLLAILTITLLIEITYENIYFYRLVFWYFYVKFIMI